MERRRRWKPNPQTVPKGFRITPRDVEMLKLLARYRYLRTSFLYAFMGDRAYTGARLTKLYNAGIVTKRVNEERMAKGILGAQDVYALHEDIHHKLSPRLSKVIKDVEEVTNLLRRPKAPGKNFIHTMMICDTLASIELGCRAAGLDFITQAEITASAKGDDPMKLPCSFRHTDGEGRTRTIDTYQRPDGLFGIRYPNKQVSFFVLEAEHYSPIEVTDPTRSSFLKKYFGYRDIHKRRTYMQLSGKPLTSFRVMFVFPTKQMMQNRIDFAKKHTPKTELFVFNHVPIPEELQGDAPPFPELMAMPWEVIGCPPAYIDKSD